MFDDAVNKVFNAAVLFRGLCHVWVKVYRLV